MLKQNNGVNGGIPLNLTDQQHEKQVISVEKETTTNLYS